MFVVNLFVSVQFHICFPRNSETPGLVAKYFDERNPAVKGLETLKAAKAKGKWGGPSACSDGWRMTQDSQDPEMLVASQNQPFKVTLRIGPMCKMRG